MNWKQTWVLVGIAAALAAFILLFERRLRSTSTDGAPPVRPVSLRAAEVTNVQLRLTNQLIARVERAAGDAPWQVTVPIAYPAHGPAIDWLLLSLEAANSVTFIPPEELARERRSMSDFGLEPPRATLTLQHRGQRTELNLGARTPAGEGVYLQMAGERGIHVVPAELFDRLPRSFNDWRDTALVSLDGVAFNRMEVRSPARGFAVEVDQPSKSFRLTKPSPARADGAKLDALWRKVFTAHVHGFVSDNPRTDPEPFGLQPPEAELVFGAGTNDLVVVQFGKSPTNDPSVVYARRLTHTNIVLAPRAVLEAVLTPHADLRDRRLMTFDPAQAEILEVTGPGAFTLRRQTNGAWALGDTAGTLADTELVLESLVQMLRLEGNVEKDFVTDFATLYGLAPPAMQFFVKAAATNAAGSPTNRVLAQLDLGARADGKVFARRPDEQSVYSLPVTEADRLPVGAWQLRDRRVWSFNTNQVARVKVRQRGYEREMIRNGPAAWSFAEGSQGVLNDFAVEEAMHRLGQLRAGRWVARSAAARPLHGFRDDGHKITIELKNGARPSVLTLEFGGPSPLQIPYALAELDGEAWVFEFPVPLYFDIVRYLSNPPRE
jgi:hypothetical protein